MGEGGSKISKKLRMSFVNGPYNRHNFRSLHLEHGYSEQVRTAKFKNYQLKQREHFFFHFDVMNISDVDPVLFYLRYE